MSSLLQFSFQGFLQCSILCSMFLSSGMACVFFAFKAVAEKTVWRRGGVSESESL
jgi:hypothetical protein